MFSRTVLGRVFSLLLVSSVAGSSFAEQEPAQDAEPISYFRDIRPIFQAQCQGCHQPAKPLGAYVMTGFDQLLGGGETGDPAIVPGKPDESYLIDQITPVDGEAEMPKKGKPLEEEQKLQLLQSEAS